MASSRGVASTLAAQRWIPARGVAQGLALALWCQPMALGVLGCDTEVGRSNQYDPRSGDYPPEGTVLVSVSIMGDRSPCREKNLQVTLRENLTGKNTICGLHSHTPNLYLCRGRLAPGTYSLSISDKGLCVAFQDDIVLLDVNPQDNSECDDDSDSDPGRSCGSIERRRIACPSPSLDSGSEDPRYLSGCHPIEAVITPNGRNVEVCTGLTELALESRPFMVTLLSEPARPGGMSELRAELDGNWDPLRACSTAWFPSGDYDLTLSSMAHIPETKSLTIRPPSSGEASATPRRVTFESAGNVGSVGGVVRLARMPTGSTQSHPGAAYGSPVRLTIDSADELTWDDRERLNRSLQESWRSPPDGTFGILVPSGTYTLSAASDGYVPQSATVVIDAAAGTTQRKLTFDLIADGAYVSGRLRRAVATDEFGEPASPDHIDIALWRIEDVPEGSRRPTTDHRLDGVLNRAWEPLSGTFKAWLRSGSYRLDVTAPGYAPQALPFEVSPQNDLVLGDVILDDLGPPATPRIRVKSKTVNEPDILVEFSHPEVEVRAEFLTLSNQASSDVAAAQTITETTTASGTFSQHLVRLSEGDGEKHIVVRAIDPAGNRSVLTTATVTLDTTPPEPGELNLAGGSPEVRRRIVDAELRINEEVVRFSYESIMAVNHKRNGCPDRPRNHSPPQVSEIELADRLGPQVVCWRVWDEAGNSAAGAPVEIDLGPYHPRPRPRLHEIAPDQLLATASAPRVLRLTGDGLASDTTVDIGAQLSLPCRLNAPALSCRASEDRANCATECLIDLPDEIRFTPGWHPVTLRTPDPVVGGAGTSNARWLRIIAPHPLIESVEPQGFAPESAGVTEVSITITGRDILPTASIRLNNDLPVALERVGREGQEVGLPTKLVATFDISEIEPSNHIVQALTIENPEGLPVSIPFGVVSTVPCEGDSACRIRSRRTYPPSLPGHVAIEATLPNDGLSDYYAVDGANAWVLLAPDGSPLAGWRTPHGPSRIRLPSPMSGARLVAHAPIAGSDPVSIVPGEFTDGEVGCAEPTGAPLIDELPARSAEIYADLNLDGESDVLLASYDDGSLHTPLNTPTRLGGSPSVVAAGDIDGDGLLDAVTGDDATGMVSVHYGSGDGQFRDSTVLPPPEAGISNLVNDLIVTDLDGDRRPDIVAAYGRGGGGAIVRWQANPDGRFGPAETLRQAGDVFSMQVGEMHRPGIPELLIHEIAEREGDARGAFDSIVYQRFSDGGEFIETARVPLRWFPYLRWLRIAGRDSAGAAYLWWQEVGSSLIQRSRQAPAGDWQTSPHHHLGAGAPTGLRSPNAVDLNGDGRAALIGVAVSQGDGVDESHDILLLSLESGTEVLGRSEVRPSYTGAVDLVPGLELGFSQVSAPGGMGPVNYWRQSCTHPVGPLDPIARAPGVHLESPLRREEHVWTDIDRDGADELVEQGERLVSSMVGHCQRVDCHELLPGDRQRTALALDLPSRDRSSGETRLLLGTGGDGPDRLPRGWVERVTVDRDGALTHADELSLEFPEPPLAIRQLRVAGADAIAVQGERRIYVATSLDGEPEVTVLKHPNGVRLEHLTIANLSQAEGEAHQDEIVVGVDGGLYMWSHSHDGWSGAQLLTWREHCDWKFPIPARWMLTDLDGNELDELVFVAGHRGRLALFVLKRGSNDCSLLDDYVDGRWLEGDLPQSPLALHIADVNVDGTPDILVGAPGRDLQVLTGGGPGAALPSPLTLEFCNDAFAEADGVDPDAVTISTPDLDGDGYPEIVLSAGDRQCVRSLVADAGNMLSSMLAIDPPAMADGTISTRLSHAGATFESATLIVNFGDEVVGVSGRLIDPRGVVASLEPKDSRGKVLTWTSESDSSSLARVLGRQPRGDWTVELQREPVDDEPGAGPLPTIRSIELLVGVRWRTHLSAAAALQCEDDAPIACGEPLPLQPRGPDGDCDADGIPDVSDPCDNQAQWPYDADMECDRPTHDGCEACEGCEGDGGGDPLSCVDLDRCLGECNGRDCEQSCLADAAPNAIDAYFRLDDCVNRNGCRLPDGARDWQCIWDSCGYPVDACVGLPDESAALRCDGLNQCLTGCDTLACTKDCFGNASTDALDAYFRALDCLERNEDCTLRVEACLNPPAEDASLDCDGLIQCLGTCDEQDCERDCLTESTPNALNAYFRANDCLRRNGCYAPDGELDLQCRQEYCRLQVAACFDMPGEDAFLDCNGFNQCLVVCDSHACDQGCLVDTRPNALDVYFRAIDCLQRSGCYGPNGVIDGQCLEESCPLQVDACFILPG